MPIRTKLILILIAFTVLPMFFFGITAFSNARNSLMDVRIAQLNNIADLKKDKIETFFNEKKADIASVRSFYIIKLSLPKLNSALRNGADPSHSNVYEVLDRQIKQFQKIYGYLNIIIINPEGLIVYSSDDTRKEEYPGKPFPDRIIYEEGRRDIYFSEIFKNKKERFEMMAAAPVQGFNGEFIGEVIIDIDMEPIYKFIADPTGLGKTGEALIARKEGNEVLFLSPLRHDLNAALKRKAGFNDNLALAAQKAVQGNNGSGIALDYEGREVLAAWRYIPSLQWGLVTKIETAEAFAPVARLSRLVIILGIIILAAAMLAAIAIAKGVTKPILSLQRGTEIIGSGNLDCKVGTEAKDEIGHLSRMIDSMTGNLKKVTASRDELNAEIAERRQAEGKLSRLNRLYSVLSKINEAIVRIHEPEKLYEHVCRIAVEDGLLKMAWIGLTDPETLLIKPVASWGDAGGYLNNIKIYAADVPEGRGPTGRAVFEGTYFICSDIEHDIRMLPWRDKALSHGFRSSAAFPLRSGSHVIGAFTIYSDLPAFFTDEEISLLNSLSEDVSFAIDSIANEKKRLDAEEALRRLNEELEQKVIERTADLETANKELEAFSYSVSHDLRSPLRSVAGFSQALMEDYAGKLDTEGKDHLERILAATQRMGLLIDDLLKLSRISRTDMSLKKVNMSEMAAKIDKALRKEHPERDIDIKIAGGLFAYGDEHLLNVVLENLLGNAWKFTGKCSKAVIEFGMTVINDKSVYFIKDNGAGFDNTYIGKLFNPFQRLHKTEEFPGTGVGLATVKRIIERHNGSIWIEGETGKGTTVYFTL